MFPNYLSKVPLPRSILRKVISRLKDRVWTEELGFQIVQVLIGLSFDSKAHKAGWEGHRKRMDNTFFFFFGPAVFSPLSAFSHTVIVS